VLSPRYAAVWAVFFNSINFIAFLVFATHVANTIGKGVVNAQVIDRGGSGSRPAPRTP
jgi:PiT family inorganic phosphate transporter